MPNINNIPTTQYIGPKVVPHLWNPIAWDASTQYDALAVVQYNGNGYVSRYIPPVGTLPTNNEYWVKWADFDAQMAQLQQTVETFDDRITDNASDIADNTEDIAAEVTARQDADSALQDSINAIINKVYHMVVIGDSFSTIANGLSEGNMWWKQVAEILGTTPHNYSHAGSGFVRHIDTGYDFNSLLTEAINDSSFTNSDVSHVFICGGVNDCYIENVDVDSVDYTVRIRNMVLRANTNFPNAEITVMGCNTFPYIRLLGYDNGTIHVYRTVNTIRSSMLRAAYSAPHTRFVDITTLLVGATSFVGDGGHPNTSGQRALAASALSGKAQPVGNASYTLGLGGSLTVRNTQATASGWDTIVEGMTTDYQSGKKQLLIKDTYNVLALAAPYPLQVSSSILTGVPFGDFWTTDGDTITASLQRIIEPMSDGTNIHAGINLILDSETNKTILGRIHVPY